MKKKILTRGDYDFFTSAQTRWRDVDTLGHINHTVYLSLLETKHKDFIDKSDKTLLFDIGRFI